MGGPLVIGLDLGGTQLRAALVDGLGKVIRRAAVRSDVAGGPDAIIAQIDVLAREVAGADWDAVAAAGLSAPGPLDSDTGVTLGLPNLGGWDNVPLRDRVAERLGRPLAIENDGIAAALGEWRYGAGRGLDHFVYITLSTGVGGGIVSDGRLLRGRRGMGGHLGHIIVEPDGLPCGCGNHGCLEAHASGTALTKASRAAYAASGLLPAGIARIEDIEARHVVAAARAGDTVAEGVLAHEAELLGRGFVSILHALSPQAIVIGGGVSAALDLLLPGIRAVIDHRAMPAFRDVAIVPAGLGDNSGLMGAAAMAFRHVPGMAGQG